MITLSYIREMERNVASVKAELSEIGRKIYKIRFGYYLNPEYSLRSYTILKYNEGYYYEEFPNWLKDNEEVFELQFSHYTRDNIIAVIFPTRYLNEDYESIEKQFVENKKMKNLHFRKLLRKKKLSPKNDYMNV